MSQVDTKPLQHTTVTKAGVRHGIAGSTLKLIAIMTMLIDHAAVVLLENGWAAGAMHGFTMATPESLATYLSTLPPDQQTLVAVYVICRLIGRLAFPIFCFLLAEGFTYTRNRQRYLGGLLVFALVSEIPFDLATEGVFLEFTYQNVFFTLCIGALTLWGIEQLLEGSRHLAWAILPTIAGMVLATLLVTDYGGYGVVMIVGLYLLRQDRVRQTLFGVLLNFSQFTAPLAFIPLWFYNGKRGLSLKWIFYAFYPGHLLLLAVLHRLFF